MQQTTKTKQFQIKQNSLVRLMKITFFFFHGSFHQQTDMNLTSGQCECFFTLQVHLAN